MYIKKKMEDNDDPYRFSDLYSYLWLMQPSITSFTHQSDKNDFVNQIKSS